MARKFLYVLLSCILLATGQAGMVSAAPVPEVSLRYLGHSAFLLVSGEHSLVIDPYVSSAVARSLNPQYILVTHDHGDHVGEAAAIAKAAGAMVIAPCDVVDKKQSISIRAGEKKEFDFGWVMATPANHPEVRGAAVGYIINYYGVTVYHAGDTHNVPQMAKLALDYPLDVALIPIGGKYTLDVGEGAKLAELIKPKMAIPMHYNTFPDIQASPEKFKELVNGKNGVEAKVMYFGQKIVIQERKEE